MPYWNGGAPEHLTLLEFDKDIASRLALRFSQLKVIRGDAFEPALMLNVAEGAPLGAILSGVALLNHSAIRRQAFIAGWCKRLKGNSPLVQFSYASRFPVEPPDGYVVERTATVLANIPPANVWVYRKS